MLDNNTTENTTNSTDPFWKGASDFRQGVYAIPDVPFYALKTPEDRWYFIGWMYARGRSTGAPQWPMQFTAPIAVGTALRGIALRSDGSAVIMDPQPNPTPNDSPAIWDLVIEDMRARDQKGRKTYGTPLQAFNGRDALVDAYQEALDLAVYLRQEIEQRKRSAKSPSVPASDNAFLRKLRKLFRRGGV